MHTQRSHTHQYLPGKNHRISKRKSMIIFTRNGSLATTARVPAPEYPLTSAAAAPASIVSGKGNCLAPRPPKWPAERLPRPPALRSLGAGKRSRASIREGRSWNPFRECHSIHALWSKSHREREASPCGFRSQARMKREGWCQEGHPTKKKPKPICEMSSARAAQPSRRPIGKWEKAEKEKHPLRKSFIKTSGKFLHETLVRKRIEKILWKMYPLHDLLGNNLMIY